MTVRPSRLEVVMQEPVLLIGVLGEPVPSRVVLVSRLEPTETVLATGKQDLTDEEFMIWDCRLLGMIVRDNRGERVVHELVQELGLRQMRDENKVKEILLIYIII